MYRGGTVIEGGIIHVVHALADVNVEAGQTVVGLNHFIQRLVGKRKERVPAKHGGNHIVVFIGSPFGKRNVFSDGLITFDLSVTVRCLVAKAGTDTKLFRNVLNGKERIGDLTETGMVIKDSGNAITQ